MFASVMTMSTPLSCCGMVGSEMLWPIGNGYMNLAYVLSAKSTTLVVVRQISKWTMLAL